MDDEIVLESIASNLECEDGEMHRWSGWKIVDTTDAQNTCADCGVTVAFNLDNVMKQWWAYLMKTREDLEQLREDT